MIYWFLKFYWKMLFKPNICDLQLYWHFLYCNIGNWSHFIVSLSSKKLKLCYSRMNADVGLTLNWSHLILLIPQKWSYVIVHTSNLYLMVIWKEIELVCLVYFNVSCAYPLVLSSLVVWYCCCYSVFVLIMFSSSF